MKSIVMTMLLALLPLSQARAVSLEIKRIEASPRELHRYDSTKSAIEAGVINGGGGKGVVCHSGSSARSLDLYDAQNIYGLTPLPSPATESEALDLALTAFARHQWNPDTIPLPDFIEGLKSSVAKNILTRIRFLPKGQALNPVNDAFEPIAEKGCEVVQVAVFYDESVILIDQNYWDRMDALNRAALLLHEIIFWQQRQVGEKTSIATRKLVGYLLSTTPPKGRGEGVPLARENRLSCVAHSDQAAEAVFYAYDSMVEGEPGVELVFNYLKGTTSLFRISAQLRRVSIADLVNPEFQNGFDTHVDVDKTVFSKLFVHLSFMPNGAETKNDEMYIYDYAGNRVSGDLSMSCSQ